MSSSDASWLGFWEWFATIGFALVLIGVVIEGVEHFIKFPRKDSVKKRHIEKIGWFILVGGLAMEFLGEKRAKRITDREMGRLTTEAAEAQKQSGIANKLAEEAKESAKQLDLAKSQVEKQLEETRRLVADANERTAKAELARSELEKQIADTAKRTTALEPRRINNLRKQQFIAALADIPKAKFAFNLDPRIDDAEALANDLASVLVVRGFEYVGA